MFYGIFYNNQLVTAVSSDGNSEGKVYQNNKNFMEKYLIARLIKDGYKAEIKDVYSDADLLTMACNVTGIMRVMVMVKLPTVLELSNRLEEIL